MSTLGVTGARRVALQVVLGQIAATLMIAALCLVWSGTRAGLSALMGGGIGVAASLAMVFFMFRGALGADPKRVMRSMYRGEAAKLGLTVLLFAAALKFVELAVLPFFVTYIATFLVYWIALAKSPAG